VRASSFGPYLPAVDAKLSGLGVNAYVFGGAVRDALCRRATKDLDLTVDGPVAQVGPKVAEAIGGTYFDLDKERGIGRVVMAKPTAITIDLTGLKSGDSIERHLRGRDFTIDAMAVRLSDLANDDCEVIDPLNGITDLRSGVVRAVSPEVLDEDPIRLLRGPRLASVNQLRIDDDTIHWIGQRASLLHQVSPERIREELVKILAAPSVTASLRMLDRLNLLITILPELGCARGVAQPNEHYYDVLNHMIETPGALEKILDTSKLETVLDCIPRFEEMDSYFASTIADGLARSTLLRLACLLHDVAKPATKTLDDTGRIRFFGHGVQGAKVCQSIMRRLRFSRKAIQYVMTIVEYHLRPSQAAAPGKQPSTRAIYRYRRDLGEVSIDTLYLNMADYIAAKGPTMLEPGYDKTEWRLHCDRIEALLQKDDGQGNQSTGSARLLDGRQIMEQFCLEPGPVVGALLGILDEAKDSGEISNKADAMNMVRKTLETHQFVRRRRLK
jgi:poly(A) polymerase